MACGAQIRRLQAERDQLRVAEQRLVSEKAALEEEMRVMRRELEAAKRERDDAIGERFVLQVSEHALRHCRPARSCPHAHGDVCCSMLSWGPQKELSQSKPATPQKPRGDQVKVGCRQRAAVAPCVCRC